MNTNTPVLEHEQYADYISKRTAQAKTAQKYGDHAATWSIIDNLIDCITAKQEVKNLTSSEISRLQEIENMVKQHAPRLPYENIEGDITTTKNKMLLKIQGVLVKCKN